MPGKPLKEKFQYCHLKRYTFRCRYLNIYNTINLIRGKNIYTSYINDYSLVSHLFVAVSIMYSSQYKEKVQPFLYVQVQYTFNIIIQRYYVGFLSMCIYKSICKYLYLLVQNVICYGSISLWKSRNIF